MQLKKADWKLIRAGLSRLLMFENRAIGRVLAIAPAAQVAKVEAIRNLRARVDIELSKAKEAA